MQHCKGMNSVRSVKSDSFFVCEVVVFLRKEQTICLVAISQKDVLHSCFHSGHSEYSETSADSINISILIFYFWQ